MLDFFTSQWPLIQTAAIVLSAIAAIYLIYYNGKIARQQSLINLIIQQRSDQALNEAFAIVYDLAGENMLSYYVPATPPEGEKDPELYFKRRSAILKVLNTQEFIAVGIRMGAFDEKVYKQLQCSNVLKIWKATHGFVAEVRNINQRTTLFQDLERLASKWEKIPTSAYSPKSH